MKASFAICAAVLNLCVAPTNFYGGPTTVFGSPVASKDESQNQSRLLPPETSQESEGKAMNGVSLSSRPGTTNADDKSFADSQRTDDKSGDSMVISTKETTATATATPTLPATAETSGKNDALASTADVENHLSLSITVTKLQIVVVYESHCPFSRKFIYDQLLPTYEQLQSFVQVSLLPFGKASARNKTDKDGHNVTTFSCQHGENECEGNKIEACTLRIVKETLTAIKIIACMSLSSAPQTAAKGCVEASGIKWNLIEACLLKNGDAVLLEVAKETWSVKSQVDKVPLVVIDGQMDYRTEYMARTDLIGITCSELHRVHHNDPIACRSKRR